ncbi:hypothetical protein [Paenibacillus thermotolerans]|uniref:hypothetical protein n=1 Tax=Paenibacillus thermotolerans TaxID=3027807 RepID=UPI0023684C90|nr:MULTISPECIES: hypothetical protein [unclassified Paenibacillus]
MKKIAALLLCAGMALAASAGASAHGANHAKELKVLVNGVEVVSNANHTMPDGKAYASIEAYADLFGLDFQLSANKKSVTFNGHTIKNVHMINGEPTAWIRDLAGATSAQQVTWDKKNNEVYVLALPEGTIQLDPVVVPAMGEHWANPQAGELPNGPIYGVYKGKLVFIEYMIAQDDFTDGKNHVNLGGMKGVPSPAVVQTDIELQPQGHPGFEIPHYDIHMYFISDEEQQAIK